ERTQVGYQSQHRLLQRDGVGVHRRFSLASSSSSSLMKSSGTGSPATSEKIDLSCRPSCAWRDRSSIPRGTLRSCEGRCVSMADWRSDPDCCCFASSSLRAESRPPSLADCGNVEDCQSLASATATGAVYVVEPFFPA